MERSTAQRTGCFASAASALRFGAMSRACVRGTYARVSEVGGSRAASWLFHFNTIFLLRDDLEGVVIGFRIRV